MKKLVPFILVILLAAGCPMKDGNPVSPDDPGTMSDLIQTGASTDLAIQTIGPSGGTIRVAKPGDPLDGLTLTVPANAFTQSQDFKISAASVISHKLGSYFNPISPMIEVTSTGGYSALPMSIKIPIKLGPRKFAMGFFYDKSTGLVEGLPIEQMTNAFIVVSTMHFNAPSTLGKTGQRVGVPYPEAFMVSEIDDSVMKAKGVLDSGFTPGTDDWEFINWGSYVAPEGNCAGQSLSALYYYDEKRLKGSPPLYHQFDTYNNPAQPIALWQDNPRGYRLASTVQADARWESLFPNLNYQFGYDQWIFQSFALALLVEKRPQLVAIWSTTPPAAGHAMIVYKVDYNAGLMYVADPNYPGNRDPWTGVQSLRTIKLQAGRFLPYLSGLSASAPGRHFDRISFSGKTAYVDWALLQKRWTQFEAGTVGNEIFPPYSVQVDSVGGPDLVDGYVYSANPMQVVCRSVACLKFLNKTDHLQRLYVYDQSGKLLGSADSTTRGKASVNLVPGVNKLGVAVCGARDSAQNYFVDFKWINVNSLTISVDPKSLIADLNKEYTFTANVLGSGSLSFKYVWTFGDGTPEFVQTGSSSAKHTFTAEGAFSVTVKLYDNTTGKLLAVASSSVTIPSTFVKDVTSTQYAEVFLSANFKADNSYFTTLGGQGVNSNFDKSAPQAVWNGLSFTSNYAYKIPLNLGFDPDTTIVTGSMSGSLSADGKVLSVLSASEYITYTGSPKSYRYVITVRNVPYYTKNIVNPWTGFYYYVSGAACQNYVSSATLTANLYNPVTSRYELVNSTSVIYSASSSLEVGFIKKQ